MRASRTGQGRACARRARAPRTPVCAPPAPPSGHAARSVRAAALPEFLRKLFDYESWAPKSSRIWRLQQYQYPEADSLARGAGDDGALSDEAMRVLQDRLSQLRDGGGAAGGSTSSSAGGGAGGGGGGAAVAEPPRSAALGGGGGGGGEAERSFSDAEDSELSSALSARISQIATATGEWGGSVDEADMRKPLTGEEMQQLMLSKYGRMYDVSFAKRSIPGKTFVALNIMWLYMGQRSFKLTPEQYAEKLDGAARLVNLLGQTDKVRAFLSAPAKAAKGLPKRPVVGTAVSIQLDLTEAQVAEWFGSGYD